MQQTVDNRMVKTVTTRDQPRVYANNTPVSLILQLPLSNRVTHANNEQDNYLDTPRDTCRASAWPGHGWQLHKQTHSHPSEGAILVSYIRLR
jgi:hypothetical protein